MNEVPFPIPTVAPLIFHRGTNRVLFCKTTKWNGSWGIPGGKVHRGESMLDAVVRETFEEVGLAIHNIRFAKIYEAIDDPIFYKPAHFIMINFFADTENPDKLKKNEEITEHYWHPVGNSLPPEIQLNSYTLDLWNLWKLTQTSL
jgi:nucleoside triphosphatase